MFDGLDESETYLITEGVNYEALSPRAMISDKKMEKYVNLRTESGVS